MVIRAKGRRLDLMDKPDLLILTKVIIITAKAAIHIIRLYDFIWYPCPNNVNPSVSFMVTT
jgi:hypothetical protein